VSRKEARLGILSVRDLARYKKRNQCPGRPGGERCCERPHRGWVPKIAMESRKEMLTAAGSDALAQ